jgi:hypothetical protein
MQAAQQRLRRGTFAHPPAAEHRRLVLESGDLGFDLARSAWAMMPGMDSFQPASRNRADPAIPGVTCAASSPPSRASIRRGCAVASASCAWQCRTFGVVAPKAR